MILYIFTNPRCKYVYIREDKYMLFEIIIIAMILNIF